MRPNIRPKGNIAGRSCPGSFFSNYTPITEEELGQSPNFQTFKEPKNWFQGTNSAMLCSMAGRYIDCLKIPAQALRQSYIDVVMIQVHDQKPLFTGRVNPDPHNVYCIIVSSRPQVRFQK